MATFIYDISCRNASGFGGILPEKILKSLVRYDELFSSD